MKLTENKFIYLCEFNLATRTWRILSKRLSNSSSLVRSLHFSKYSEATMPIKSELK